MHRCHGGGGGGGHLHIHLHKCSSHNTTKDVKPQFQILKNILKFSKVVRDVVSKNF